MVLLEWKIVNYRCNRKIKQKNQAENVETQYDGEVKIIEGIDKTFIPF